MEAREDWEGFEGLSLGAKQLVHTYAYAQNDGNRRQTIEGDIIPYLKWVEAVSKAKDVPTFGIEINLEGLLSEEDIEVFNRLAGKSELKQTQTRGTVTEIRINPSYGLIVEYLIGDIWRAQLLPKNRVLNYVIAAKSTKNVEERSMIMAVANITHGITGAVGGNQDDEPDKEEVTFPSIYFSECVDIHSGKRTGEKRLNLYVGIAGNFEGRDNELMRLMYTDFETRIGLTTKMALLGQSDVIDCEEEIGDAHGLIDEEMAEQRDKWETIVKKCGKSDLSGMVSEEKHDAVKWVIKKYEKKAEDRRLKVYGIDDIKDYQDMLPKSVKEGLTWMQRLTFSSDERTSAKGKEMLEIAGGPKARRILRALASTQN